MINRLRKLENRANTPVLAPTIGGESFVDAHGNPVVVDRPPAAPLVWIRGTLPSLLATGTASFTTTSVTDFFGGPDPTAGGLTTITVHNSDGEYHGKAGTKYKALQRDTPTDFEIIDMVCNP